MSGPPAQALATHLINQTLSSLSVLETLEIISRDDAAQIRSKLPNPYGPFPSLQRAQSPQISSSFSQLTVGPASPQPTQVTPQPIVQSPPPNPQSAMVPSIPPRAPVRECRARALWDYNGTEPDDLRFRAGDTIIVDEEVNEQWYRGRVIPIGQHVALDRSGLFPSNYIEKEQNEKAAFSPGSQHNMVPYQAHYQGPPQHPMVTQPTQPQGHGQVTLAEQEKKNRFGKIGSQLGNSAVHGAGFGFGASIASNVVNKSMSRIHAV